MLTDEEVARWAEVLKDSDHDMAKLAKAAQQARQDLRELCHDLTTLPKKMQKIMLQNNIVIKDHDDPMQKMVFTLYTVLVRLATGARDNQDKYGWRQP